MTKDVLGKKATAKTGVHPPEIVAVGKVFMYCDAPTVGLILEDGSQMTWRADLCTFEDWTNADEIAFQNAEIQRLNEKIARLTQELAAL